MWSILSILYFRMFYLIEVPQSLKLKLLLPLFKGKGTKPQIKIIIGVLRSSPFFVKFLNFSF